MIRRFALASAVLIAAASATPAMAGAATSNLDVSANVPVSCNISTSPLVFGAYDPIGTNASNKLSNTGSVSTTCSSGSAVSITLGQGSNPGNLSTNDAPDRRLKHASTDNYLSYQLYSAVNPNLVIWGNTNATGVSVNGTGSSLTTNIYGEISPGQNVPVGNYTDIIVATVTY
jgi:spore coat protein U-like protein